MAEKTTAELIAEATVIKNNRAEDSNTADLVGQMLIDLSESQQNKTDNPIPPSGVTLKTLDVTAQIQSGSNIDIDEIGLSGIPFTIYFYYDPTAVTLPNAIGLGVGNDDDEYVWTRYNFADGSEDNLQCASFNILIGGDFPYLADISIADNTIDWTNVIKATITYYS